MSRLELWTDEAVSLIEMVAGLIEPDDIDYRNLLKDICLNIYQVGLEDGQVVAAKQRAGQFDAVEVTEYGKALGVKVTPSVTSKDVTIGEGNGAWKHTEFTVDPHAFLTVVFSSGKAIKINMETGEFEEIPNGS